MFLVIGSHSTLNTHNQSVLRSKENPQKQDPELLCVAANLPDLAAKFPALEAEVSSHEVHAWVFMVVSDIVCKFVHCVRRCISQEKGCVKGKSSPR